MESIQDYIGGQDYVMALSDFAYPAEKIVSTESPMVYPIVSWVRPSDWMLWMKMRDGQGPLAFTAIGRKLTGYKGLPNIVNNEVALNHPGYTVLPLLDDTRPNETAWTVFRNRVVAR